jgi:hypothetical protein
MKTKDLSFKEALARLRARRPVVCPNLGFELQLKQYDIVLRNFKPRPRHDRQDRREDCVNRQVRPLMNRTFVIRNRSLDATDDQIGQMALFRFGIGRK